MKRFEANQPGSRAFLKRTFLVLFFFVSIHALTAGVSIDGDGAEYLAYTRSFAYRFSPFLKAGDFDSKANQEKFTQLENSQGTPLGLGKNSTEIIEDPDGLFFSVHFWLYSLFCAPLLLLLESLGQNGGKTFILTNYLMACGAFYYILFQSRQTAFFRYPSPGGGPKKQH